MSGQARALIDSMSEQIATEAPALSFDEAFTLHHRAVFRTARAVLRDAGLAEDVTQEVFLRLYRNLDSTPGDELLRPWLLRVTLNVARNTCIRKILSVTGGSLLRKTMNGESRLKRHAGHLIKSMSPCVVACC